MDAKVAIVLQDSPDGVRDELEARGEPPVAQYMDHPGIASLLLA
jgi:hypothetical protein